MSSAAPYKYLAEKPKSFYRQLFIKDRWISARTLYGMHINEQQPMTVEEISADCDLPLAAVEEAIAYCASNPPEIAEDAAREEAIMEASGKLDPGYRLHPQPKLLTVVASIRGQNGIRIGRAL
jgi:hypothetical protein